MITNLLSNDLWVGWFVLTALKAYNSLGPTFPSQVIFNIFSKL